MPTEYKRAAPAPAIEFRSFRVKIRKLFVPNRPRGTVEGQTLSGYAMAGRARFRPAVERYQAGVPEQPPYRAYAAIVGAFGAGMAGVSALASLRGRRPEQLTALDLAVLSAATFKAARTVAHDEVLSFLRQPFVQGEAHEGEETPLETGDARQAIGELLTCSRCIGMWAAAGVVGLHTVAPRTGRLLTWSLAASAANDFLQAGFAALTSKANELEQQTGDGSG